MFVGTKTRMELSGSNGGGEGKNVTRGYNWAEVRMTKGVMHLVTSGHAGVSLSTSVHMHADT